MYTLNVCLLASIFEKNFGLVNFTKDYTALLGELNAAIESVNNFPYSSDPEEGYLEYQDWLKDYKLFCKLVHFFDDFNHFINSAIELQTVTVSRAMKYRKDYKLDRVLSNFISRIESMSIPKQIKDTVAGFLKMQRAKAALSATREDSWLLPDAIQAGNLHVLTGTPINFLEKWGRKGNLYDLSANFNAAPLDPDANYSRNQLLSQISFTLQKFPDLRFGQLIANVTPAGTDLFYLPDAKLIQLLKDFEAQYGLS